MNFDRDDDVVPRVGDFDKGGNLGDMWSSLEERHNHYWNITRPAQPVPAEGVVAGGQHQSIPATADNIAKEICKCLKCMYVNAKPPIWLAPTATSIRIDRKTSVCVPLPPGSYATPAPFVDILCIDIPDLCVGTIWGIGMLLEDDQDFDVVEWREQRNGATLIDGLYRFQKGDPTLMRRDMEPVPIILPPLSRFCVMARNTLLGGPPKCATLRITGQIVPIKEITSDGSFGEYCSV